jgi:pimeloyl-ACP methyl ester carboxylesterase
MKKMGLVAIFCLTIVLLAIGSISWKKWLASKPQAAGLPAIATGSSSIIAGNYYQASMPPVKDDDYQSADFRMWIPHDVKTIRGVIVKQHGCGDPAAATGLDHANDLQWQALATKHQFALLGSKFTTGTGPCEYWSIANYGSGAALIRALNTFAKQSQHPEIERVPWAIWGHSGGADWGIQMMQQYPDRTIAAIAARGGAFFLLGNNPTIANTPVLFALGEQDRKIAVSGTQDLPIQAFKRYRKLAAPWTLAIEAGAEHEVGDTRQLAIPYLDAIITQRLPSQGNDLQPIDPTLGWLGNVATKEISPIAKFTGERSEAAWLPNEETARKWQQYVTTGKIPPTQKPSVPTNLQAIRRDSNTVLLTWQYQPDLESGLPAFRIDRNKSTITTIPKPSHNFGDAPDPPLPVLEFSDKNATLNAIYSIAAINDSGESNSESISAK